ncbi:type VI secretion system-associated FHA domain protein TagH [Agarivorans sp. QJM3NY_33]|uniref:type VI secretion system-associated FHA domain protein TagH n=1 Tax=Agarivorans sp. QJM3NY_33 TaxID=3421432 RepID=UPI003D7C38E2
MDLCLSVMSYHRFTSGVEEKKHFFSDSGESVLTIGRASQCSWCLPDPERVISSRHARVEFNQGVFWLYDTSTNGVFVNRSVEPIEKDKPYQLVDGDILAIGDYEIAVNLSALPEDLQTQKVISAPVAAEDFGVLAEPSSPAPNSLSLDSSLNANLSDAFILPSALTQDSSSNIPEDWNALFANDPRIEKSLSLEPEVTEEQPINTKIVHSQTLNAGVAKAEKLTSAFVSDIDRGQSRPSATPLSANSIDEQTHLGAFLEGMGISADLISQENPIRWWHQLGGITRDSLDGIMNTLHNRAAFKENTRINQTTFRKNENNPLKFSTNAEDALHNLLQRKTSGFLPPERAVKEAFIDLERHEYALLSGVEGAVASVMQLLDPKSIASKVHNTQGIAKYYSAIEKHKSWNRYCSVHSDLEHEFSQNNNAFYMEDFAKAYEATLKRIDQKGQR